MEEEVCLLVIDTTEGDFLRIFEFGCKQMLSWLTRLALAERAMSTAFAFD
jgi:hypothetical protein